MKRYTMSFAAACEHKPTNPERTARRSLASWDIEFQTWSNRKAMARSIRMQQRREPHPSDWRPCVALTDGEGY
jgi:hypothetical protein